MIYHFGLEGYLGLALYCAGVAAFLASIFWRPVAGIYYLIPLIPLQTTRYRMMAFPLGASVVSIMLVGTLLGNLRQRRWIVPRTPVTAAICCYALFTLATLFLSSHHLFPRFKEWCDFMTMPLLCFMVAASVKDAREMKLIVLLMCLAVFVMDKSFWDAIKGRDFSGFSRDLQESGAMGYAGVQGMSAFNAQYAWLLAALCGSGQNRWVRLGYLALGAFAANCVMYSFSRGGYAAFLCGWLFIGIVKRRVLLVAFVALVASFSTVAPAAVRDRVFMTYDARSGEVDHSAAVRLELWNDAIDLFQSNPVLGAGYHTYAFMKRLYNYGDTHNIYLKVLVETGVIGLLLLLWLLASFFRAGYAAFRRARDPFFSALGLGLCAWVVCTSVSNLFGDRWTYLQINGYLWTLAGLVSRALEIEAASALPGPEALESPGPVETELAPAY